MKIEIQEAQQEQTPKYPYFAKSKVSGKIVLVGRRQITFMGDGSGTCTDYHKEWDFEPLPKGTKIIITQE